MPDQPMPTVMTFVKQPAAANVFYSRTKQVECEMAQRPTSTARHNINTRNPDVYHYRRSRSARWDKRHKFSFRRMRICYMLHVQTRLCVYVSGTSSDHLSTRNLRGICVTSTWLRREIIILYVKCSSSGILLSDRGRG